MMLELIAAAGMLLILLMTTLWMIHLRTGNAGIVDAGWAAGLAFVAVLYAWLADGYLPRRVLIGTMVFSWGMRLALHLLFDRVIGQEEEGRYRQLRKKWKTSLPLKFFFFFNLQGVLNLLLALPFLLISMNPAPRMTVVEFAGAALWFIAVLGEATADRQLKQFKADPSNRGQVCNIGLWKTSRHPNYFFEWLTWVGYFVMALGSPYGWISIICPAVILYLLLKVTGIPATEEQAVRTRGDAYREYQRTTSAFVPWFRKA